MDLTFPDTPKIEISKLLILVPQGAEYQAILQGIRNIPNPPSILAIPVGILPVTRYLQYWQRSPDYDASAIYGVILMGLGGSLSADLGVGQLTLLESCLNYQNGQPEQIQQSDRRLNDWIQQKLGNKIQRVQAITSDRVITEATEKQELGKRFNRQVVEMEGGSVLSFFTELGIPVTIVRVISDDITQCLPDLNKIYDQTGKLNAIALAAALLKEPIRGLSLILGSLKALKYLEQISRELYLNLGDYHDFTKK